MTAAHEEQVSARVQRAFSQMVHCQTSASFANGVLTVTVDEVTVTGRFDPAVPYVALDWHIQQFRDAGVYI